MEFKSAATFIKSIKGREVVGLFAVHGNVDEGNDISHPGSFTKTINERVAAGRVKHLWSHTGMGFFDSPQPPTAVIRSMRELTRAELPEVVVQKTPSASGGVEVTREYLDTPRGNEVLEGIKAGAITEMSYGYNAIVYDFSEVDGEQVRNIREVRLWETSDVLWGMNEATLASKWLPPAELFLKQIEYYLAQLKAGARHSAADTKLLNQIHHAAVELGATLCKGIVEEEEEEDDGKS